MRLLGAVIVALMMYVAVPMLWERAMVHKANAVSANRADLPVGKAVEVNWAASENVVAAVNGALINQEEMNRFEQIGAEGAANDAMRQARAAQDRAWQATHP